MLLLLESKCLIPCKLKASLFTKFLITFNKSLKFKMEVSIHVNNECLFFVLLLFIIAS